MSCCVLEKKRKNNSFSFSTGGIKFPLDAFSRLWIRVKRLLKAFLNPQNKKKVYLTMGTWTDLLRTFFEGSSFIETK